MPNYSKSSVIRYQKLMSQVIDSLQDAICVMDRDWKVIKYNQSFLENFPLVQENNDLWNIFIFEKITADIKNSLQIAMQNAEHQTGEFFSENQQKYFYYACYPFDLGIVLILRNITSDKEKEERLKKSKYFLNAILDSTTDTNILIDKSGKVLCFNKAASENICKLYGKKIQEGQDFIAEYGLAKTRKMLEQDFINALEGKNVEVERQLFFPNGEQIWVLFRIFPVFDENKQVWAISLNYTNIQELKKQYEKLEEIARLQSHTIRRPLASILGLIDILNWESEENDDSEKINQDNKKIIALLKSAAEELDAVIHEIIEKTYK